jgi:endo-1,4-beta-xylanase
VRSDLIKYWNQITPENESKWDAVEPQRDVMNWSKLDAIHKFAVDNNIPFKGHTFVWGSQQPSWIAGLSQQEQAEEVEEWIKAFCDRYPDVAMIDVVNEPPPHTTPAVMNALGGPGQTGYDWIIQAFKLARTHCPNAILILNDYNVLRWNTDSYVNIVNAVKGSGYIDAMGEQAHGLETISFGELQANLEKVLGTGLPLYITEYDINEANDETQKNIMEQQFTLFWNTPEIKGITLWGYVYGATWQAHTGLIKNGNPRPAMTWLMTFLGK